MYGKVVNQKPATEQKQYLSEGINENIFVKSFEYISGNPEGYARLTLSNEKGESVSRNIFPFKPVDWKTKKLDNGQEVRKTDEEQKDEYLLNIKHIFSAAVGEENYDKAISKATDFKSFVTILNKMGKDNYSASKPFRIMLISKLSKKDGKYYSSIPDWENGFVEAEGVSPKMKFNVEKYGKKTLDSNKVEQPANVAATDSDLPF